MKVKLLDSVVFGFAIYDALGILSTDISNATDLEISNKTSSKFETDKVKYYFDESKGMIFRNEKLFIDDIKSFVVTHNVVKRQNDSIESLSYYIIAHNGNKYAGAEFLENLGK